MVYIPNVKCPKCASIVAVNPGQSPVCPNCGFGSQGGARPAAAPQMSPPPQQWGGNPGYGNGGPAYGVKQKTGLGIAGMVLGIIGMVLFCIPYVGIPCALVGVILSGIQLSKIKNDPVNYGGKGMAITGLVLSIIALAWLVLVIVFFAALISSIGAV